MPQIVATGVILRGGITLTGYQQSTPKSCTELPELDNRQLGVPTSPR